MSITLFDSSTVANPIPNAEPNERQESSPLEELESVLRKHFYQPDFQALRVVLGVVQSHRLKLGDPVWLFAVAPPGSGKTTMSIMGACGLPEVVMLGDFSENTFLSGFFGHERAGMLEKLGHTSQDGKTYISNGDGVFVAKDFTTVLSMRREKRAAILGQLREIHDGQFKRDFGTGVTKIWKGRISFIAAVTPVLDRFYSIFSTLGERFLQVRWHRPNSEEAGVWAIKQQGKEQEIQTALRNAVGRVLKAATQTAPELSDEMKRRISCLAEIVAQGRTHIYRNGYGNREIEFLPEPESNTRIAKALAALVKGVASIRGHKIVSEDDLQDVFRVGLDCLPDDRRRLFLCIARGKEMAASQVSKTMQTRELEELRELGVLERTPEGEHKLSARTERLWRLANVK